MNDKLFFVLRFFKNSVKHFSFSTPSYFKLLRDNNLKLRHEAVLSNDIFIVTSCLNPHDSTESFDHNANHKFEQRFLETVSGLESIRKYYPNSYIIFLENSQIPTLNLEFLMDKVDEYFNYSECEFIKYSRRHQNKGVPQFMMLLKFCQENSANFDSEFIHIISARYIILDSIAENKINNGAYFLYNKKSKNVSTRYYCFKKVGLNKLAQIFKKTLFCAILGCSVEDVIFLFTPAFTQLSKLNIYGVVGGVEKIYE